MALRVWGPSSIEPKYGTKVAIEHLEAALAWDVDISIHEAFITPEPLVVKQNFTPEAALNVGTRIHTSPAQFGKVMAET